MKRIIVAMGDSTTAGTPGWKSPIEAPPAGEGDRTSQYAWWLMEEEPDWDVLNHGVNGERSDQIRARFQRDVIAHGPGDVVIIAGVNDVYQGRDPGHVIEQLGAMYDAAGVAGIALVAGTIVPYNTATTEQNSRMRQINVWIAEWISSHAAGGYPRSAFADTRAAVASRADPDRLFDSPDGLHPSPEGYRRMAAVIRSALQQLR